MKVNICGIPYDVEYCKDAFNVDAHFGQIEYKTAKILINEEMTDEMKAETLCHEILHGIFVHIGRSDLNNDEPFVQMLGNAINQTFAVKVGKQDDD